MDFQLVIIELFSVGASDEALRANIDWKPPFLNRVGQFGPKFQVEGYVPHHPFFVSQNQMHRPFMQYENLVRRFFHFVTIRAFARQTDGRIAHSYTAQ